MFAAGAYKLEKVLEQRDELILALAVGQKQREENGKVAGTYEDLFCDVGSERPGSVGLFDHMVQRRHITDKGHGSTKFINLQHHASSKPSSYYITTYFTHILQKIHQW